MVTERPRPAAKKPNTITAPHSTEHRGNRHGRSEEARTAILEAADNLLVERGFAGVTMEGIAAAAGVAKQTVYRWWKSKTDVLMDAFLEDVTQHSAPTDLGALSADLRQHLLALANLLTISDTGTVFRALMAEAQHDPELAVRLRERFIEPQRRRDLIPFERAVKRGELGKDFDKDAAAEYLLAPIYYRVLVSGQSIPASYIDELVRRLLLTQ